MRDEQIQTPPRICSILLSISNSSITSVLLDDIVKKLIKMIPRYDGKGTYGNDTSL